MLQRPYLNSSRLHIVEILIILGFAASLSFAGALRASTAGYSDLYVDCSWLRANQNSVTIVDARSEKDFKKGHISGAISAPWQPFTHMEGKPGKPGWGTLLPPEELMAKISVLGIDASKPLVVYADLPGWGEDGRFAWMAMMLGIADVKILDGGYRAWKEYGGETTKEKTEVQPRHPGQFQWNEALVANTEWISSQMGKIQIVDSRAKIEFAGVTLYGEERGGHLPGAISIPFEKMFESGGRLKSKQQLKALFETAGLNPESEIVTYCTAGIRSAHMALVLRMTGFSKARNYDASFYEWAAMEQLPLE